MSNHCELLRRDINSRIGAKQPNYSFKYRKLPTGDGRLNHAYDRQVGIGEWLITKERNGFDWTPDEWSQRPPHLDSYKRESGDPGQETPHMISIFQY